MKDITNCIDCPFHQVINDPDPDDWFCDDDKAVVCTKKQRKPDFTSKYVCDRQEFEIIASACRPYNLRKESQVPRFCPLGYNKDKK
jgi:hypothetical protein